MRKNINVVLKDKISDEALKKYYSQLCITLKEQYGNDVFIELYRELSNKR